MLATESLKLVKDQDAKAKKDETDYMEKYNEYLKLAEIY